MACTEENLFADGFGGARGGGDCIDDRNIIRGAAAEELFKEPGGRQK